MDAGVGVASPEMEPIVGTVLDIAANNDNTECLAPTLPRRLRRRLLEPKTQTISAQDIEAKLRDAYLRRQQIYESLSNKARSKSRSGSSSSDEKYLHLQTKHKSAEQKRLTIIGQIQNRLARLDQLRQDAKNGAQLRLLKERDELSTKMELRMQQAETNRLLLLNAIRQRQVAKREKASELLIKRLTQQKKYKECIRNAIYQKRSAAQRKRLGFLESQQVKARASALQVQEVARSVEIEQKKVQNQLENPLQRPKRLRADNLSKKGSLHNSSQASTEMVKQMELFNKLTRCWRQFVGLKGTTFALAKAFENLEINKKSVKSMPFERLAALLDSGNTTSKVKALLHRIESRVIIRQETNGIKNAFHMQNVDHLLKPLPGKRVVRHNSSSSSAGGKVRFGNRKAQNSAKLCRYPVRVVLGAYIISGHPDVASSGMGKHEIGLVRAATEFLEAFELLIKIMLRTVNQLTFSSQLGIFDKAWCSYLHQFVTWKVKDSKSLEDDLVRAASQLEDTRHAYKKILEGDSVDLAHVKSLLDQKKQNPVSVNDALEHMESNKMELGISSISSPRNLTSSAADSSTCSAGNNPREDDKATEGHHNIGHVLKSMLNLENLNPHSKTGPAAIDSTEDEHQSSDQKLITQNSVIVNEIVHGHYSSLANSLIFANEDQGSIKSIVRVTMEKAFWDGIMESLKQDTPDYSWVLKLIKEVRDELCRFSPSSWRQEIDQTFDLDILSQVSQKDTFDIEYCGNILEFSLGTLRKLSAPAKEDKLRNVHEKLLRELAEISQVGNKSNASFALVIMRGLRFVLKEIQVLKQEISKARLRVLEPLIKGSAGFEYLRSSFANNYGSPSDASSRLPLVSQWLSSVLTESEQNWAEYMESLSEVKSQDGEYARNYSPTTLRAGGSVLKVSTSSTSSSAAGVEQPECKGEKLDLLLRLGLLKLVNQVDGLTAENLPETFRLNLFRLTSIQSRLQKIIVISASILVLRQMLLSQHLVNSAEEMENVISDCVKRLAELLDSVEDVGISAIVETMNFYPNSCEDPEKIQERKDIMSNMLGRSLSARDAVFLRVSRSVYLAASGIVLGGSGEQGKQLAANALKRIGAAFLAERLVNDVQELVVMVHVSKSVHLAWYEQVLKNI